MFCKNESTHRFSAIHHAPHMALCRRILCLLSVFPEFVELSLGSGHSLVLKHDGTVWAAGTNMFGHVGSDATSHSLSDELLEFAEVFAGGAIAVAAGGGHSLMLKEDGSVWSVGVNIYGQLGDGSNADRQNFVQVIPSYAKAMSAGTEHSLVVMRDGSVWGAGFNFYGQLGDGSGMDRSIFVAVIPA